MAGRTRLISVPSARGGDDRHGFRQLAGSMGQMAPDPAAPMDEGVPATKFEAPTVDDAAWQRTVAMREAAEGLPSGRIHDPTPLAVTYSEVNAALDRLPHGRQPLHADLTSLPDRFSLEIERKGERWKITSPGVHAGLWKAGVDLPSVVEEALAALSEMVRVDGVTTQLRRRNRK